MLPASRHDADDTSLPVPLAPAIPQDAPASPGDWMKSEAWLANVGHFLGGLSAITVTALFTHALLVLAIVTAAVVAIIGVKEVVIDPRYESNEDLVSGFWDWTGWAVGLAVGWGLFLGATLR